MRIFLAGLLALALAPVVAAQSKVEVKDLSNHPFNVEFPSNGSLRMHLQSGDFQLRGRDENRIAVHMEGKNVGMAKNLTVRLTHSGHDGDLHVYGGPKNELQITIEIPKSSNLYVRMRGGDLKLVGVVGDKDVKLVGGDLTIETGDPQSYALVDASVRFGDVHADSFGDAKGWMGGALKKEGSGKYKLHAHVFAGDLTLIASN